MFLQVSATCTKTYPSCQKITARSLESTFTISACVFLCSGQFIQSHAHLCDPAVNSLSHVGSSSSLRTHLKPFNRTWCCIQKTAANLVEKCAVLERLVHILTWDHQKALSISVAIIKHHPTKDKVLWRATHTILVPVHKNKLSEIVHNTTIVWFIKQKNGSQLKNVPLLPSFYVLYLMKSTYCRSPVI